MKTAAMVEPEDTRSSVLSTVDRPDADTPRRICAKRSDACEAVSTDLKVEPTV